MQKKERVTIENQAGAEQQKNRTVWLAKMGLLIAISVVFGFIHIPFPPLPFLEFEFSDIPILIAGFAFGPVSGIIVAVGSILLHDLIAGMSNGFWGVFMHLVAALVFVVVSSVIYKHKKTRKTALIGLIVGGICLIVAMIPANMVITPIFLVSPDLPIEQARIIVKGMLPLIILFNLIKAVMNTVIVFFLYKRISPFLHKWQQH